MLIMKNQLFLFFLTELSSHRSKVHPFPVAAPAPPPAPAGVAVRVLPVFNTYPGLQFKTENAGFHAVGPIFQAVIAVDDHFIIGIEDNGRYHSIYDSSEQRVGVKRNDDNSVSIRELKPEELEIIHPCARSELRNRRRPSH